MDLVKARLLAGDEVILAQGARGTNPKPLLCGRYAGLGASIAGSQSTTEFRKASHVIAGEVSHGGVDPLEPVTWSPHISCRFSLNLRWGVESAVVCLRHSQEAQDLPLQAAQLRGEDHGGAPAR